MPRPIPASPVNTPNANAFWGSSASFWVVIGALWFALLVYCMGSWVLGPDFVPNTFGRDQAPESMVRMVRSMEVVMVLLTAYLLYYFVFRPWLRDGKLSFDGLFFLASGAMVLQEPWLNWTSPQLLYNTVFFNMGSWMGYLPLISSPVAQKVPVSIAFAGFGYFWIVAGPAWCGSRFMGWAKARNPNISKAKLIAWCFLGFCVFDAIIESVILRTNMFIYPSTIGAVTLFAGETYQFPMYEMLHWCAVYTSLACIHFFRNDRGETWADQGMSNLVMPARLKVFLRWLAMMGLCQMAMLFTYNIPYQWWAMHGDSFVVSEATHPWLTAQLCGPSTAYDCAGPGVPIARRDSPTNRITPLPTVVPKN